MDHIWARVGTQVLARVSGPLKFRIVLQPAMAFYLAIRGGLADAKKGSPPYFWALLWDHGHRLYMVKEGWKSIERVFLLALVMDVIYQIIVLRHVHLGEAIIVGFILAVVPYLILRGPVNRIARRRHGQIRSIGKQPPMSNAA